MASEFYENLGRESWGSLAQPRTRVALDLAGRVGKGRILDVGCADGEVSLELARLGGSVVVGVDISEAAVATCRSRGLEAYRSNLDQEALPLADDSFDLVYMAEVIEHLARPDQAIVELRRVLVPGGHLLITTPNLACLPNRLLLLAGLQPLYTEVSEELVLGRGFRILGQRGRPVGHLRLFTRRALVEFLDLHGFDVVAARGAAFHSGGVLGGLEGLLGRLPGLAMQMVVLARRRGSAE